MRFEFEGDARALYKLCDLKDPVTKEVSAFLTMFSKHYKKGIEAICEGAGVPVGLSNTSTDQEDVFSALFPVGSAFGTISFQSSRKDHLSLVNRDTLSSFFRNREVKRTKKGDYIVTADVPAEYLIGNTGESYLPYFCVESAWLRKPHFLQADGISSLLASLHFIQQFDEEGRLVSVPQVYLETAAMRATAAEEIKDAIYTKHRNCLSITTGDLYCSFLGGKPTGTERALLYSKPSEQPARPILARNWFSEGSLYVRGGRLFGDRRALQLGADIVSQAADDSSYVAEGLERFCTNHASRKVLAKAKLRVARAHVIARSVVKNTEILPGSFAHGLSALGGVMGRWGELYHGFAACETSFDSAVQDLSHYDMVDRYVPLIAECFAKTSQREQYASLLHTVFTFKRFFEN